MKTCIQSSQGFSTARHLDHSLHGDIYICRFQFINIVYNVTYNDMYFFYIGWHLSIQIKV